MTNTSTNRKPTYNAYQVRNGSNGKGYWNKIGAAWSTKDYGFTIQLDAVPLDGRIVLRLADKPTE